MNRNLLNKMAFTIAEILIVLGIVGIIAQMTIPSLIQSVQQQTTVVSLKKAYTNMSQAYASAVAENGTPDNWDLGSTNGAVNLLEKFAPYLRITKNCGTGKGCWPSSVKYKYINGSFVSSAADDDTALAKAQLADGTLILFVAYADCTSFPQGQTQALKSVCGYFYVDINGFKPPNAYGVDFFDFWITNYGILPDGSSFDTQFENACNSSTGTGFGYGCTAWVIYNENMDYLKCPDKLSWSGNHSCLK